MRTLVALVASLLATAVLLSPARADIAPPKPPKKNGSTPRPGRVVEPDIAPLVVTFEADKASRLIIPRKILDAAHQADQAATANNRSTMVAGVALSLAAVSLVFVGRRSRRVMPALAVVVLGTTTALVYAAVPPPADDDDPNKFPVQLEVSEKGDTIRLIIDRPLNVTEDTAAAESEAESADATTN